ncbi:IclR family transcriptional regulator [Bradyrhizobium diazoefficiens]|uniref:Putative transcriptional regulatory protein n=1 Tax=Bradyrhizobium diazoefficiens SEMIA 5080 TaxID=754504 RepID=A0A837CJD8_9BRAD|nr:IclR family transcriptional regulator [Bradyrhizobium diazoefficiens]APO54054.1 IclR family transcriptional regulator [Bradyrhizobium diazoefficiens]KGJ69436.1 putative transcriptional regulatory protein [Bradyrhizobium diazoefficiens SEMIA 5080]KOY11028.1 IclR family transcriptional regulator [Bradyrhizobium diazoefficiens]MCD9292199.1 IclR family transcriptional regulator [Bradyrhizobium diazoefficiens]MCD9808384.1 IclR family transcriptional regulator [Bradyrhizobium diazoefficiens]
MAKVQRKAAKRKPEASPKNPRNYVASVGKAFAVLRSFTSEAFELTLSEVAARADLDRGTAFRLIQTLIELGYLQPVPQSRRFRLGLACLDLGYTVLSHGSLRAIVEPLLRDLVPDVGDAASLGILDGGDVIYLARVGAGLDRHKMDRRPGSRIPAYSAALGHVVLAHLPRDEQIERLEARPRVKLSERTLTDLDALLARLDLVKKKGHAISDGENAYGLRTLATPIFDAQGVAIGGLSVTIDAMRMDMPAFRDQALPRLMQVTRQVQDIAIKSGLSG